MRSIAIPLMALLVAASPVVAAPDAKPCPPGLAKKNPPCVPPGQAKKIYGYAVGDLFDDDGFILIGKPWKYGLPAEGIYYHRDSLVIRVDPDTGKVLALIGAIDALLD